MEISSSPHRTPPQVWILLCLLLAACAPPPPRPMATVAAPLTMTPTAAATTRPGAPTVTATPWPAFGEMHLAVRDNIKTLNPYLTTNASEELVVSLLYDTLLDDDPERGLQPYLAERWELSPDGGRLTCWLHPQARWHDGRPVTATDVVFSLELARRAALPGLAHVVASVHRAEAIHPNQVEFTLLTTRPEAIRSLCTRLRIVPAAVWADVEDPLQFDNLQDPIGSGPFAMVEYAPEERLVMRNTRAHPTARASIDTLVVEILRDETKALQWLKDDKLDALGWEITPSLAHDVLTQPETYAGIEVAVAPGLAMQTLMVNLRRTPYDNPALRSALAQALDTQAAISTTLLGWGDPGAASLCPVDCPWHNGAIPPIAFSTEAAAEQLTKAGFVDANGDGRRETPDGAVFQIALTCARLDAPMQLAEWIAEQWQAVGIAAKAAPIDQDQVLPTLMQAGFDVILHTTELTDPQMAFLYFHSSRGLLRDGRVTGLNFGGYENPEYDETVEAMLEERDPVRRQQLLWRLQEILAADIPQIPLFVPRLLSLYREDRFTGWSAEPGLGLLSRRGIAALLAR